MESSKIYKLLSRTIELGEQAFAKGNYPIGSLISDKAGNILLEAENTSFTNNDPSAHAEMNIFHELKSISQKENLILFTSLEPCIGCSFFLTYTKIKQMYVALEDNYKGGMHVLSNLEITNDDIAEIKVFNEPFEDLKFQAKELMYRFLVKKGKHKAAENFK